MIEIVYSHFNPDFNLYVIHRPDCLLLCQYQLKEEKQKETFMVIKKMLDENEACVICYSEEKLFLHVVVLVSVYLVETT